MAGQYPLALVSGGAVPAADVNEKVIVGYQKKITSERREDVPITSNEGSKGG